MGFPKQQEPVRHNVCECRTDGCCCAQPLVVENGAATFVEYQEAGPIDGWRKPSHTMHRCGLILAVGAVATMLGAIGASWLTTWHIVFPRSRHEAVALWMPTVTFQRISYGSCIDIGWLPIANQSHCEQAAAALGLEDTTARLTTEPHRPDGCYFLFNERYGTGSLWLSTNKRNAHHGATASFDWVRQPICKAQKIVIPTTTTATTTTSLTTQTVSTMTTTTTTPDAAAILQTVASEIASPPAVPHAQILGTSGVE